MRDSRFVGGFCLGRKRLCLEGKLMKGRIFHRPKQLMIETIAKFDEHGCPLMAAGMSFFAMLSLIPLTLLGISALGYVLGSSESARQFVNRILLDNFPRQAAEVLERIDSIITSPKRNLINGLGLLGLLWPGMKFFNMLQGVLNKVWVVDTHRRFLLGKLGRFLWTRLGSFLWNRAAAFVIFGITGLLFWLSFLLDSLVAAASQWDIRIFGVEFGELRPLWLALGFAVPFGISVTMIFLIYVLVPRVRVSLKAAVFGAISAAFLIQALRLVFSFLVVRFNMYGHVYGPLASVIVFMSWMYFAMNILLLGAEIGSQSQQIFFNSETGVKEMVKERDG